MIRCHPVIYSIVLDIFRSMSFPRMRESSKVKLLKKIFKSPGFRGRSHGMTN